MCEIFLSQSYQSKLFEPDLVKMYDGCSLYVYSEINIGISTTQQSISVIPFEYMAIPKIQYS